MAERKYRRTFDWEAAKRLHQGGWSYREIAKLIGVSESTVRNAVLPGYREDQLKKGRLRKEKYRGVCETCGSPTTYGPKKSTAPVKECRSCRKVREHEERHWTPERIIAAFQEWSRANDGATPTIIRLHAAHARLAARSIVDPDRRAAYERMAVAAERSTIRVPTPSIVVREFGSFPEGVRAAGFEPLKGGWGEARGEGGVSSIPWGGTCRSGRHEWTPENVQTRGDVRRCRACKNEQARESYHRRKNLVAA